MGNDVSMVELIKVMSADSDQKVVQLVELEPHLVDAFGEASRRRVTCTVL